MWREKCCGGRLIIIRDDRFITASGGGFVTTWDQFGNGLGKTGHEYKLYYSIREFIPNQACSWANIVGRVLEYIDKGYG